MIFCDECKNFPPPDSKKWGDDNKKVFYCLKNRPMQFYMPQDPNAYNWGFCKEKCRFYEAKEKPQLNIVKREKPKLRIV